MFPLLIGILVLAATVIISAHCDNGGEILFWDSLSKNPSHSKKK